MSVRAPALCWESRVVCRNTWLTLVFLLSQMVWMALGETTCVLEAEADTAPASFSLVPGAHNCTQWLFQSCNFNMSQISWRSLYLLFLLSQWHDFLPSKQISQFGLGLGLQCGSPGWVQSCKMLCKCTGCITTCRAH